MSTELEMEKRAIEIAALSKCVKRKVGAVLAVKFTQGPLDRVVYKEVTAGCNAHPTGEVCEDINGETLPEVRHAEITCLNNYEKLLASTNTIPNVNGLVMFVTHQPCGACEDALAAKQIPYRVVKSFMKFSHAKPRMALVPPSLEEACARALTYGARKYKVNNWRETPDIEEYISALQRHFNAFKKGEDNDPESGLNHLDHMAANLSFLIELKDLPKLKQ